MTEIELALSKMSLSEKTEFLELIEMKERIKAGRKLLEYRPYKKQIEFHHDLSRERLLMAGNQLGKTLSAAAEVSMHLTGKYPEWWEGRVFKHANHWLAGSESGELTRRGVQRYLLGRDIETELGTGMIPRDCIIDFTRARGVAGLVDTVYVKNSYGGTSTISLKSYDQGRSKWQADTVHGVWFDEEPPEDIYFEGLTRTNTTMGSVMMTFTPLNGMSSVVKRYVLDKTPNTGVTIMTINDAEHYTPEQRAQIIASYPAYELEARANGVPTMGSGLIFPVTDESIVVNPFKIPPHWALIIGIDFGWDHPTAAVALAWDKDSDVVYVVAEYRAREVIPALTVAAIKPWGDWIPVAWPHDGLQHDKGSGEQLMAIYRKHGLNMLPERATHNDGSNGVGAGLKDMLERMMTGRWKVFRTCTSWLEEKRMYHMENGQVVKIMDDTISASRYAYMMRRFAKSAPPPKMREESAAFQPFDSGMGY